MLSFPGRVAEGVAGDSPPHGETGRCGLGGFWRAVAADGKGEGIRSVQAGSPHLPEAARALAPVRPFRG